MKSKSYIILFLLLILGLSTKAKACESPEAIACSMEVSHSEDGSCSCCEEKEMPADCNGTCCHCFHVVNFSIVFKDSVLLPAVGGICRSIQLWTYIQQSPRSAFIAVWQPPKIG